MLKQLVHNGVIIPDEPEPLGLTILVRGEAVALAPKQEEMAMAWARKKDTPYVQDAVFVANFLRDFSTALGVVPALALDEVDFTPCFRVVEAEREAKARLTREERKALAAQRRARREELKARYGYAIVNGQRVELGAYTVEPSGIFMGRGQHPLRGRWKEGAKQCDVALNLSPDAPLVEGEWAEVVWQPESMWVARWRDKLSGRPKYVWLADTAPIKQEREARKFDQAIELEGRLEAVRAHIRDGLVDPDPLGRMIATACYLIDTLCLRVGDEKDPDEADTIGATTLRPEHVTLGDDGVVRFKFLGKDSVLWHKELKPSQVVLDNLAELIQNARPSSSAANAHKAHPTRDRPQLFADITSRDVNAYLSSIHPGLTAKVFRTHHATMAVRESLSDSSVGAQDPEHAKWRAANMANLQAAILCNHTKQLSANWPKTRERFRQRRVKAEARVHRYRERYRERKIKTEAQVDRYREQIKELIERREALQVEAREKQAAAKTPERRRKTRERHRVRIKKATARIEVARQRRKRAQIALDKIVAQAMVARKRAQIALDKIVAQATVARRKRTWNLNTSLKSYIDPRVYYGWGKEVDYDVLGRYYPSALRRKFGWVRTLDGGGTGGSEDEGRIVLRTCMQDDLKAVAELFRAVSEMHPTALPPLDPGEIGSRFLPALGEDWREAVIALDDDSRVVGFAALGPEWRLEERVVLDLYGALRPGRREPELVERLADEVRRRLHAYQVHFPRVRLALCPRDRSWIAPAQELFSALRPELAEDEPRGHGETDLSTAPPDVTPSPTSQADASISSMPHRG